MAYLETSLTLQTPPGMKEYRSLPRGVQSANESFPDIPLLLSSNPKDVFLGTTTP